MIKLVIGIPTRGNIPAELHDELMHMIKPPFISCHVKESLVDDARNALLKYTLETDATHLFMVDDDMRLPDKETIKKMVELDKDMVLLPYRDRKTGKGTKIYDENFNELEHLDETKRIYWGGGAVVLIKREVLEKIANEYLFPFEFKRGL